MNIDNRIPDEILEGSQRSGSLDDTIPQYESGDAVILMNEYERLRGIIERIKRNDKTLESLTFRFFEFHNDDLKLIKFALDSNSHLKKLVFYKSMLDNDTAQLIAEGITQSYGLQEIRLYQNGLTDVGGCLIAKSFGKRNTITSICISKNYIGMKTMIALSESLKSNRNITNVKLLRNDLGVKGAFFIARILENETGLTSLSFSYNKIGDLGSAAIAERLQISTLKNLTLKENGIGLKGATAIAEALRDNCNLEALDLSGNVLGDEGCLAIGAALSEKNTHLTSLDLSENGATEEGQAVVLEHLQNNSSLVSLILDTFNSKSTQSVTSLISRNKNVKGNLMETPNLGPFCFIKFRLDEGLDQNHWKFKYEWTEEAWESFSIGEAAIEVVHENIKFFYEVTRHLLDDDVSDYTRSLQARFAIHLSAALQTYTDRSSSMDEAERSDVGKKILLSFIEEDNLKNLFLTKKDSDGNTFLAKAISTNTPKSQEFVDFIRIWVKTEDGDVFTSQSNEGTGSSLIEEKDLFIGRYKVKNWPRHPMYKSSLSCVYSAIDHKLSSSHTHYNVAIEIAKNKDCFKKELEKRLKSMDKTFYVDDLFFKDDNGNFVNKTNFSEDYVMPLIRYHEEELCFIMPLGDRNLDEIIRNELIDEDQVRMIIKSVAMCIHYLHNEHGMIHGDIKPRNFVRHNGQLKMFNFYQADTFNNLFESKSSTGYSAPELVRELFISEKSSALRYWFHEEKKIMKKLIKLDRFNQDDHEEIIHWENRLEEVKPHIKVPRFGSGKADMKVFASPTLDVWSFGVLSYYLLTGTQLFRCDQFDNIPLKDIEEQRKLLNWDGIDSILNRVCLNSKDPIFQLNAIDFLRHCLNPDPRQRFRDMNEALNHTFFMTEPIKVSLDTQGHKSSLNSISHKFPTKFFSHEHDDTSVSEISSIGATNKNNKRSPFCGLFF